MIYIFIAEGFEEVEAIAPIDIIRRAGLDVASIGMGGKTLKGSHGISMVCDYADSEIYLNDKIDAVILPGGMPGTTNLENSKTVNEFLDFAAANNKLIAAICAAPSILGKKGLLKGKKACCFPSFEKHLIGADVKDDFVIRDGNIITAKGMGVAIDFGIEIVKFFLGDDKANEVKRSLQCKTS